MPCCRTSPGSTCPPGIRAGRRATTRSPPINGPVGFHDQALTNHNETRHLLQVGYVDHQVGLLLARLRRTGLFDQAMIVVTADHGIAFEVGVKDRRLVTERNVERDRADPAVREGAGADRRARWTRACAHHRHRPDDGRPARRRGPLAPRRALGVRAGHPAARRGGAPHPRLQQGDQDRQAPSSPGGAWQIGAGAPGSWGPGPRASCCSALPGRRSTGWGRTRI